MSDCGMEPDEHEGMRVASAVLIGVLTFGVSAARAADDDRPSPWDLPSRRARSAPRGRAGAANGGFGLHVGHGRES